MSLNRNVWNAAGIDFGEYNTLILQKSLKKLTQTSQASFLRFWGKILGTEKDYYIVEGSAPAPGQQPGQPRWPSKLSQAAFCAGNVLYLKRNKQVRAAQQSIEMTHGI